jgi:hypothetical protein
VKDLLLKDDNTSGLIIENLILTATDLSAGIVCPNNDPDTSGKESPEKKEDPDWEEDWEDQSHGSFIIEKCRLLISEGWLNRVIESDDSLEGHGAKKVRVDMGPDRLSISGEFKVGVNVRAAVDLLVGVKDGCLQIDLDRIRALSNISLPRIVQNALMGIVQDYMKKKMPKGVKFAGGGSSIIIDHNAMLPGNIYFDLTHVYLDDKFLVIQGGADREKCLEIIREKREAREQEEARKRMESLKDASAGQEESPEKPDPGQAAIPPVAGSDNSKDGQAPAPSPPEPQEEKPVKRPPAKGKKPESPAAGQKNKKEKPGEEA